MHLTDFDALSFDCYGTLIDWEAGIAAVLRPWASQQRAGPDRRGPADRLLRPGGRGRGRAPDGPVPADPRAGDARRRRTPGAPVSDARPQALAVSVPDWPAFPDSADALARLATRYRLSSCRTSTAASFAGSNRRLGVTFAGIVTAQDVGSYKPSPRNFDALLAEARRLGVPDGRLLHVAQSLFHDHVPAKAIGLPTVWINRRHDAPGWGATPEPSADVAPGLDVPVDGRVRRRRRRRCRCCTGRLRVSDRPPPRAGAGRARPRPGRARCRWWRSAR